MSFQVHPTVPTSIATHTITLNQSLSAFASPSKRHYLACTTLSPGNWRAGPTCNRSKKSLSSDFHWYEASVHQRNRRQSVGSCWTASGSHPSHSFRSRSRFNSRLGWWSLPLDAFLWIGLFGGSTCTNLFGSVFQFPCIRISCSPDRNSFYIDRRPRHIHGSQNPFLSCKDLNL